jgi:Fic family protein
MSDAETNIHALDAAYKPFPSFEDWSSLSVVDTVRWERYNASLKERSALSDEVLHKAREIAKRAAAIDTGAIEGLYEVDRGFTYTVAFETAAWEAALASKGENVRPLFEAQLHAYDFVLDLATKAEPISEAAIRALHQEVCRAQQTYSVMTAVGPQEQPLPKGQYKVLPNHVRTRKGVNHSYAPVDMTPPEMARLIEEMRKEEFLAAHPVLQAAYAHFGLVVIHPFADGNGRVARALASTFTYRAISMPIMILSEQKIIYLEALENADEGDYQVFVDFMLTASLNTVGFVDESVRSALSPSLQDGLNEIAALYITRGGYTVEQVEKAGEKLLNIVSGEVERAIASVKSERVSGGTRVQAGFAIPDSRLRIQPPRPGITANKMLAVDFRSSPPAAANLSQRFNLFLPKDAGREDDIQLMRDDGREAFVARMDEVMPSVSGNLQMRAAIFAEGLVGRIVADLKPLAEKALRGRR